MLGPAVHRVMRVRGPNNVGETVETDPTLLHYFSAISESLKIYLKYLELIN